MRDLAPAYDRDDGKPWVPWSKGHEYVWLLPGHRERVELDAWFDRRKGSLILTLTQFDESMGRFEPCWAQLGYMQIGQLHAQQELLMIADLWSDTVKTCFDIPGSLE